MKCTRREEENLLSGAVEAFLAPPFRIFILPFSYAIFWAECADDEFCTPPDYPAESRSHNCMQTAVTFLQYTFGTKMEVVAPEQGRLKCFFLLDSHTFISQGVPCSGYIFYLYKYKSGEHFVM